MAVKVKAIYWSIDHIDVMPVERIRGDLYSHAFCAFADLHLTEFTVEVEDYKRGPFRNFNQVLHAANPDLKTLLSIGGGGRPTMTQAFAAMASNPVTRNTFINSTIQVARQYGFDGVDLDYEFPRSQDEMNNLGALVAEWRAQVQVESATSPLLLTAAVIYRSTNYHDPPVLYPTESIAANLDWINVMAYDFSSPDSEWGSPNLTKPTAQLRVRGLEGVESWLRAGVPSTKIVLGIPFYGYAWKLTDSSVHGYDAPASGPTDAYGKDEVFYGNIMSLRGYQMVYDDHLVANYCYNGDTWISYDGVEAVKAKVNYVNEKGLLGYFGWQLAGDDQHFTLSTTASLAFDR